VSIRCVNSGLVLRVRVVSLADGRMIEPDGDLEGALVDRGHKLHLVGLLDDGGLVNADGVYPEDAGKDVRHASEEVKSVGSYLESHVIKEDRCGLSKEPQVYDTASKRGAVSIVVRIKEHCTRPFGYRG